MDKIDTVKWNNYFGNVDAKVLHASERYSETFCSFEEPGLAKGKVRAVSTPGMMLTEFFMQGNNRFQLLDSDPKETVESVFILEGDVESHFSYFRNPVCFNSQNHNIHYSTEFAGNHIIHSGNFHALTITYDLSYLSSILQSSEHGSLQGLSVNLGKRQTYLATNHAIKWNHQIAEVVRLIRHCEFQGPTRYIFIESKMLELFALQMEHLHSFQKTSSKEKWRKEDRDKIHGLRDYIETAYLEPLNLRGLSLAFGLNEYKLKKGYRHFFNMTVFEHILQLRMQKAQALLNGQQLTVSDVAHLVGYNNASSFSYEFKKRFGYSPRQIRALA